MSFMEKIHQYFKVFRKSRNLFLKSLSVYLFACFGFLGPILSELSRESSDKIGRFIYNRSIRSESKIIDFCRVSVSTGWLDKESIILKWVNNMHSNDLQTFQSLLLRRPQTHPSGYTGCGPWLDCGTVRLVDKTLRSTHMKPKSQEFYILFYIKYIIKKIDYYQER